MPKIIFAFLIGIVLSACMPAPTPAPTAMTPRPSIAPVAAPSLTPAPTSPPVASRAPAGAPTAAPIKVTNEQSKPQGDGTTTTATLSTSDGMGLGQIEFSRPDRMIVNETGTVVLRISPAQQLAAQTPISIKAPVTIAPPGATLVFGGNVQLLPTYIAELRALRFAIDKTGPVRRDIDKTTQTVEWKWLVSPQIVGKHDLTLEISIPITVNGVLSELSTDVLQTLTITIQVDAPPPPTATPAPSAWKQVGDSIIGNAGAIIVALIGLTGTVLGIVIKARLDKEKADADAKKPKT